MEMKSTESWKLGDKAQKEWAKAVSTVDRQVIPLYGMEKVDDRTAAPVIFTGIDADLLVAPDLLVIEPDRVLWNEVKAKSVPGAYRKLGRWEHGIDFAIFQEYLDIQKKTFRKVYISLKELKSPESESITSELIPCGMWLGCWLDKINEHGRHSPTWPGGKDDPLRRGRDGMGGWLWPRSIMSVLKGALFTAHPFENDNAEIPF